MTLPEWEFEIGLLENLNTFIGVDLKYVLGIPQKPLVGERMLYLLRGGPNAARQLKEGIVSRWAIDANLRHAPTHHHVANLDSISLSEAPEGYELRVVDLLGDLAFGRGQRKFLRSKQLSPSRSWNVRWMLGTIFLAHRRLLAFADFRNSRVGILFIEPFFFPHRDAQAQKRQVSRLLERLQGALTLKNRYSRRNMYRWIKVINIANGPQYVALMGRDDELSIEEIPYPDL